MNKLLATLLLALLTQAIGAQQSSKPRILISTDIGGTDPDDNQSLAQLRRSPQSAHRPRRDYGGLGATVALAERIRFRKNGNSFQDSGSSSLAKTS